MPIQRVACDAEAASARPGSGPGVQRHGDDRMLQVTEEWPEDDQCMLTTPESNPVPTDRGVARRPESQGAGRSEVRLTGRTRG
eukprot:4517094-Lingulodinium_polyedra.AAC.1